MIQQKVRKKNRPVLTLLLCSVGQQAWLYSQLALEFFAKIKAFVRMQESVLYFSFNFTRFLTSPILKQLYTFFSAKTLFINFDTFK